MPPKRGKDEPVEKAPEGDDERMLNVGFKGVLSPKLLGDVSAPGAASTGTAPTTPRFQSELNSPYFTLTVPTDNSTEIVKPPLDLGKESDFNVTALQKKILIAPNTIQHLLGSHYKVTIYSCAEAKPAETTAHKKAPAKKNPKEGNTTARSDDSIGAGDTEVFTFEFELSNVLTKDSWTLDLGNVVPGFEELEMQVTCSQPLLCHANMLKYQPVTLEVVKVECLPPTTTIGLLQTQNGKQTQTSQEIASLQNEYMGVAVKYDFFGHEVITDRREHDSVVDFKDKRIFFLHSIPPLELAQKLFAQPLRFELHDRDTKDGRTNFYGVGLLSLRTALDGVQKFTQPMQVVPHTEEAVDAPVLRGSEYLALGTMLQVKLRFLLPVSPIEFVPEPGTQAGEEAQSGDGRPTTAATTSTAVPSPTQHPPSSPKQPKNNEKGLSRVILRIPYSGPLVRPLLQAIMGTLIKYDKCPEEGDIQVVQDRPKTPPPVVEETKPRDKRKDKNQPVEPPKPIEKEALPPVPLPVQLYISNSVSGFEVMDESQRLIVIEGPREALNKISEVASAVAGDDDSVTIIFNTSLVVPRRIYPKFPPLVLPLPLPKKAEPKEVIPSPEDDKKAGGAKNKGSKARATPDKTTRDKPAPPEVPPLQQQQVPAQESTPPKPSFTLNRDELDSGGVGGRIRRIRLSELLPVLEKRQKNFIHRTFTRECLRAITKLNLLTRAHSMIEAVDHDYFPTAGEVIALERVAGMTLETMDVCGANKFFSFSSTSVDDVVADAVRENQERKELAAAAKAVEIDFNNLSGFIGKVVSFVAVPATADQLQSLPSLDKSLLRYPHKGYLYHMGINQCLPCAFSVTPPTQLLRFDVTAQVVESTTAAGDSEVALYVMSFVSLAKKGTDSRNPNYEAALARNARKAPPKETKRIRDDEKDKWRRTHQMASLAELSDTDSDNEDLNELPVFEDDDFAGDREVAVEDYVNVNKSKLRTVRRPEQPKSDYSFAHQRLAELEAKEAKKAEALKLNQIKAKKAFSTNKQTSAQDDRKHPLAPSGSRVDDLKQEWVPPTTNYSPGSKDGGHRMTVAGAKGILGDPFKVKSIFQSDSAVEAAKQEQEDRQRELDLWKSKVVVEDPTFRVVGNKSKDTSNILDKQKGMLVDDPKKLSIKKGWTKPPPVSIREVERMQPLEKVDPKMSKYPANKQFYYARQLQGKIPKISEVPEREKVGPLYYDRPSFKPSSTQ